MFIFDDIPLDWLPWLVDQSLNEDEEDNNMMKEVVEDAQEGC